MRINSDELAESVRAVLEGIGKGVSEGIRGNNDPDTFSLSGPFQVGITSSLEAKGEVKIFVVGLHGPPSSLPLLTLAHLGIALIGWSRPLFTSPEIGFEAL